MPQIKNLSAFPLAPLEILERRAGTSHPCDCCSASHLRHCSCVPWNAF